MATNVKVLTPKTEPAGLAVGRKEGLTPGPQQKALNAFIGKWLTEGHTIASADAPAVKIVASDVYEWVPGEFFVLHTAYGRIGDLNVGGIEVMSYDAARQKHLSQFFGSGGDTVTSDLTVHDGNWTWAAEKIRCIGVTSPDGKTMTAHHERTDDSGKWIPSMEVTLTRVE